MQAIAFDLESAHLESGGHNSFDQGYCAMELAAYLAGEPHSDHPQCVSPVLGAFLRNWNDSVDDAFRQSLKPFIPRILNTAHDGKDEVRAWMATDWLVRVCAPAWLDLAKLTQHAMALRTAEEIHDLSSAKRVQPLINDALRASAADWDAARSAAGSAARSVSWAAARSVSWAAARDVSWAAAWSAARDAAGDAAGDALQPTVESLQRSALVLLDRMITGGRQ